MLLNSVATESTERKCHVVTVLTITWFRYFSQMSNICFILRFSTFDYSRWRLPGAGLLLIKIISPISPWKWATISDVYNVHHSVQICISGLNHSFTVVTYGDLTEAYKIICSEHMTSSHQKKEKLITVNNWVCDSSYLKVNTFYFQRQVRYSVKNGSLTMQWYWCYSTNTYIVSKSCGNTFKIESVKKHPVWLVNNRPLDFI